MGSSRKTHHTLIIYVCTLSTPVSRVWGAVHLTSMPFKEETFTLLMREGNESGLPEKEPLRFLRETRTVEVWQGRRVRWCTTSTLRIWDAASFKESRKCKSTMTLKFDPEEEKHAWTVITLITLTNIRRKDTVKRKASTGGTNLFHLSYLLECWADGSVPAVTGKYALRFGEIFKMKL